MDICVSLNSSIYIVDAIYDDKKINMLFQQLAEIQLFMFLMEDISFCELLGLNFYI